MEDYAGITSSLKHWLNREGFAALESQLPLLIAMAQRRIHEGCDLNAMEEVASVTIDSQTLATPADFLRTKSLFIVQGGGTFELEGASAAKVMSYSSPGRPSRFAVIGGNFYFSPIPDAEYTGQLIYYKSLDILSETTTTNWISENRPELLLFAALLEASLMLKDDARAQVWEGRYQATRMSLLNSEERMDKPYGNARVRLA
jgi:hypothetical protein